MTETDTNEKLGSGSPSQDIRWPASSEHGHRSEDLTDSNPVAITTSYLEGWRLHMLTAGMWLSLLLSTLETTIVGTSLVSITDSLHGFRQRDWIVTSYLVTYTGFLVIYSKLSDIFGLKEMLLIGIVVFTIFSILCGAASHTTELIIFRAFQGIGASGMYAIVMASIPSIVRPEKYAKYTAVLSTVFVVASVLGPILGGAINAHGTWRWVFLLNAPAGVVCVALIAVFMPSSSSSSPVSSPNSTRKTRLVAKFSKQNIAKVDFLGAILLLASSTLGVFALEEGGSRHPWTSPAIIASITLAGLTGILFFCWEYIVAKSRFPQEPMFPLRILTSRRGGAMMATAFFIGFPFNSIVVNIPQRSQAVKSFSPMKAGLTLLPLLLTSPMAIAISGVLTSKFRVPSSVIIVVGCLLQLIGVGLTCSLPTDSSHFPSQQYGFEVLMGLGFGACFSSLLTFAPVVVEVQDLAVAMGAITQVRVLGGTISLAISSTILNNHLQSKLESIVTPGQLDLITESLSAIETLSSEQGRAVRRAFAEGYNLQNVFLTVFSGISLLASLLLVERGYRGATEV